MATAGMTTEGFKYWETEIIITLQEIC